MIKFEQYLENIKRISLLVTVTNVSRMSLFMDQFVGE